jgi:hypothetical protein
MIVERANVQIFKRLQQFFKGKYWHTYLFVEGVFKGFG